MKNSHQHLRTRKKFLRFITWDSFFFPQNSALELLLFLLPFSKKISWLSGFSHLNDYFRFSSKAQVFPLNLRPKDLWTYPFVCLTIVLNFTYKQNLSVVPLDMVFLWYSPFQWLAQPFNQLGKPEFTNTFDISFSFSLSVPWITKSCLFIICQIKCPQILATALIYSPMASHWITVIASKRDFPILLLDPL